MIWFKVQYIVSFQETNQNQMLTRRQLFDILYQQSGGGHSFQTDHLFNYLVKYFKIEDDDNALARLKKVNSRFCSNVFFKFNECSRTRDKFLHKNNDWLSNAFIFDVEGEEVEETEKPQSEDATASTSSGGSVGRHKLRFSQASSRTKRRRAEELSSSFEAEELTLAAGKGLKQEGKDAAAKLIAEAVFSTPTRASKMHKSWQLTKEARNVVPYSDDEAVSLIIEGKLSKHQYLLFRREAKLKNADIYPSYHKVLEAKSRCYPPKEAQIVTESSAEILLQELLDHTTRRILELQEQVISSLPLDDRLNNLVLLVKWGCDGSTGHSQYKQKFTQSGLGDGDLFLTSLVPLQLYVQKEDEEKVIIWQNPRPSSTRFCRPIRFQFKKETAELILQEKSYVDHQIKKLSPTKYRTEDYRDISVSHVCVMTMIDGKVCNALTDTPSAQTCYVCKATPKEMNNIDSVLGKQVDEETFQFGLSTLHAWIRFFECLLHVSYRLQIKKWQVRGEVNRAIFEERKRIIQNNFRNEMGLLVDIPKSGGSGTTNDGNTARRFFKNATLSASITGVDETVIKRFGVILQTVSCGYEINAESFNEYALQTARLFVDRYPWFYMPATVHKILLHGSAIINAALLPIGQLSEEAQESRNKDLKKYRELYTRKLSRISTNQDLLNRLLISSDPLISSLRKLPQKKISSLSSDILFLLKKGEPSTSSVVETETESDVSSASPSSYSDSDTD